MSLRSPIPLSPLLTSPRAEHPFSNTPQTDPGASADDGLLERDDPEARRCRVCGCTDDNACPAGCWWVEVDLCSECTGLPPEAAAVAEESTAQLVVELAQAGSDEGRMVAHLDHQQRLATIPMCPGCVNGPEDCDHHSPSPGAGGGVDRLRRLEEDICYAPAGSLLGLGGREGKGEGDAELQGLLRAGRYDLAADLVELRRWVSSQLDQLDGDEDPAPTWAEYRDGLESLRVSIEVRDGLERAVERACPGGYRLLRDRWQARLRWQARAEERDGRDRTEERVELARRYAAALSRLASEWLAPGALAAEVA